MRYRSDIDGLRAVAVLSVVIFHVTPEALPGGFVGVDMFFAISGFLISGILWEQFRGESFALFAFYAQRSRRLLPALYVTLASTVLTALALFPVEDVRETAWSAIAAVGSLSNIRFALQSGYFDVSAYRKSLLHTWSLGVEEQFYLIWPVLLKLLYKHRDRFQPIDAIRGIVVLVGVSEFSTRMTPSQAYFLAPFRVYQFVIGAAVHVLPPLPSRVLEDFVSIGGAICTTFSMFMFSRKTPFPGLMGLMPTVGTAALLYTGRSTLARGLALAPLTEIGRISYSVYLVHWPIIVAYTLLSSSRDLMFDGVLFLIFSALGLGYCLHYSVEARFRHRRPEKEGMTRNIRKNAELHTLVMYMAMGVLLCILAYVSLILAEKKKEEVVKYSQVNSLLNEKHGNAITGLNLSAAQAWRKLLCSPQNRNWCPPISPRSGVMECTMTKLPNKKARYWTYAPERRVPEARVLLLGDSHADALRPILIRFAMEKRFHLESLSMSACFPLLTLGEYTNNFRTRECKAQQDYWRSKIEKEAYDFIFLASRWTTMYEGERYGKYSIMRYAVFGRHGEATPGAPVFRERFKQSLNETLGVLLTSGASVIILGQVPDIGKNIRGCLQLRASKTEMLQGAHPTACVGVARRDVLRRSKYMNNLFLKLDYENKRVRSMVTTKYFCDNFEDDHCRTVYARTELYIDDNHLSCFGSALLGEIWTSNAYEGVDFSFRNPKARTVSFTSPV